ncbi:MAG: ribonuclease P protein component [Propionibacteriaceae bacterium]
MLPAGARLRTSDDFRTCVRRGRRAGRQTVVVHACMPTAGSTTPTQVGFVVSKAVGNAVIRNRVKRRLRHLVRELLPSTPQGMTVVIRALPAAATQEQDLSADLLSAWRQLTKVESR